MVIAPVLILSGTSAAPMVRVVAAIAVCHGCIQVAAIFSRLYTTALSVRQSHEHHKQVALWWNCLHWLLGATGMDSASPALLFLTEQAHHTNSAERESETSYILPGQEA